MTATTESFSHYITGQVRYVDGALDELVVICAGPMPEELEAMGHIDQPFIVKVDHMMVEIKKGTEVYASFNSSRKLYPIRVVNIDGKETLEIADIGQTAEFKTLRNLPTIDGE